MPKGCLKFRHVGLYLEPVLTSHGAFTQILLDYHRSLKLGTLLKFLNSGRILDFFFFFLSKHQLSLTGPFGCWRPILHMRVLKILRSIPQWLPSAERPCRSQRSRLAGDVQRAGDRGSRYGWGSAALSVLCFEIPVQGTTDSRKCCSLGWE